VVLIFRLASILAANQFHAWRETVAIRRWSDNFGRSRDEKNMTLAILPRVILIVFGKIYEAVASSPTSWARAMNLFNSAERGLSSMVRNVAVLGTSSVTGRMITSG